MTEILEIGHGSTTARILPERGFNCFSLVIDGFDYMHQAPDLFPDGSLTRSGCPILFPWPNRIAGARFTWDGSEYHLPVTEPATGSSLHGYACHSPWHVVSTGPDHATAQFVLEADSQHPWPGTGGLRVTYRVESGALIVTSEVFAGTEDLPFGLGFHPYLRVPGPFDQWHLQCDAAQSWPLSQMIPTGQVAPVDPRLDFRTARTLGDEHLDDVLTGLPPATELSRRASLASPSTLLTISSDPAFREYVLFTPTSRDAVAVEPYTCPTDAVHLEQRGMDAGWRVLPAGHAQTFTWRLDVS